MKTSYAIVNGVEVLDNASLYIYDWYHKTWHAYSNEYTYYNDEGSPISQDAYEDQLYTVQNENYLIEELNK